MNCDEWRELFVVLSALGTCRRDGCVFVSSSYFVVVLNSCVMGGEVRFPVLKTLGFGVWKVVVVARGDEEGGVAFALFRSCFAV